MEDLIAFMKARLDEDERIARAVTPDDWGDGDEWARHEWEDLPDAAFAHAKHHDPARVLREVEAKRQMLTRWEFARNQVAVHAVNGSFDEAEAWDKITGGLELDNRAIAAVWSGHPDYRAEWKP